jgi:hypothetical protein
VPFLGTLSGIPLDMFLVVASLTAAYLIFYLTQGVRVGLQLWLAVRRIEKLKSKEAHVDPDDVARVLTREPFRHLWSEYQETLHEMTTAASGATHLVEVRATVLAEVFFTRDALVDGRLLDDFTRHLPGVLTGLGIIGTFAGLLEGLGRFDVTSSASAIAGLRPLLTGVAHAFTASAAAIFCAMLVVFTSRLTLAYFYRLVERLNRVIDSLYAAGASEEYLSRLVRSSEKSEAHAAQLKQALVEDLTTMMNNIVDRQISAQSQSNAALGTKIASVITEALADPMRRITAAIETTNQGSQQAVSGMLESLLTGFMAKLEDTFGGQMRGIQAQMGQSMAAMTSVQQALQNLVADIGRSNEQATTKLSGTLDEAMKQAAANQQLMTEQMREFVQNFRKLVTEEQEKSRQTMDQAVTTVLERLAIAVEQMESVRTRAAAQEEARNAALTGKTQEAVNGFAGQVETLLALLEEQTTLTRSNLEAISNIATRAIDGMTNGALTMGAAAQRFETAGNAVSGIFDRSARVSEQLTVSANALQTASSAVRYGFEQYDATRKTVEAHVATLSTLIENARKEAGLSRAMLDDLERIVNQLKLAENQSLEYLEGVNRTLGTAFEAFGTQLAGQIRRSIGESDGHLSKGVQHLNGVVQELGSALARLKRA